jgi:hypothetical protein
LDAYFSLLRISLLHDLELDDFGEFYSPQASFATLNLEERRLISNMGLKTIESPEEVEGVLLYGAPRGTVKGKKRPYSVMNSFFEMKSHPFIGQIERIIKVTSEEKQHWIVLANIFSPVTHKFSSMVHKVCTSQYTRCAIPLSAIGARVILANVADDSFLVLGSSIR